MKASGMGAEEISAGLGHCSDVTKQYYGLSRPRRWSQIGGTIEGRGGSGGKKSDAKE
jgi:hypothetical protein